MSVRARFIIDPPASGVRNMAVDEALLIDAAEHGVASLRFYGWNEPTLSLGYFQKYADRQQHAASRHCAIVRRQTGGGAILHDRELTYSLVLPASHPLTKPADGLYRIVHRSFVEALSSAAEVGGSCFQPEIREHDAKHEIGNEPFLCFQRQSRGDVIVVAAGEQRKELSPFVANLPTRAWKILGSAQRRYRGAVLQHGSLLLQRSPAAPELPGIEELSDLTLNGEEMAGAVSNRLAESLGGRLGQAKLPPEMESKIEELANNKYGSASWTNRR